MPPSGWYFKPTTALLGWVEGAASDRGNPLKRLAVAQYRLLGSLPGLTPFEGAKKDRGGGGDAAKTLPV